MVDGCEGFLEGVVAWLGIRGSSGEFVIIGVRVEWSVHELNGSRRKLLPCRWVIFHSIDIIGRSECMSTDERVQRSSEVSFTHVRIADF